MTVSTELLLSELIAKHKAEKEKDTDKKKRKLEEAKLNCF